MRFAAQTKPETGVKAHRTRSARMHWIWCRDSSNGRNSAGGNAAAGEQRFPWLEAAALPLLQFAFNTIQDALHQAPLLFHHFSPSTSSSLRLLHYKDGGACWTAYPYAAPTTCIPLCIHATAFILYKHFSQPLAIMASGVQQIMGQRC